MTQPTRILFIEANLDGTIGGSHHCLLEIVRGIDKSRFDPVVMFFEHNDLEAEFRRYCPVLVVRRDNNINLVGMLRKECDYMGIVRWTAKCLQMTINLFWVGFADWLRAIVFLRKNEIEIVHVNNAPYLSDWLAACKLLGISCTAHLRGNWKPKRYSLRRVLIRHYDLVIAISRSVRDVLAGAGVETRNVIVINDGIDLELEKMVAVNSAIHLGEDTDSFGPIIGVIGNIKPWKGQHVLIEAVRIMKSVFPDIRCIIVGDVGRMREDVEYSERLIRLVKELNLEKNVRFLGFRRDALNVMDRFEVLVHTSIDPEPMGRVILEAMLLRKPVIATAHGGPLDIIEDGISGFLVAPNDPEVLAEKLMLLLKDGSLRETVGRQARARVEDKFGLAEMVNQLEIQFEKVAATRQ